MHSTLQQNKVSTTNIKFKFKILETPSMNENMDTKTWIR